MKSRPSRPVSGSTLAAHSAASGSANLVAIATRLSGQRGGRGVPAELHNAALTVRPSVPLQVLSIEQNIMIGRLNLERGGPVVAMVTWAQAARRVTRSCAAKMVGPTRAAVVDLRPGQTRPSWRGGSNLTLFVIDPCRS